MFLYIKSKRYIVKNIVSFIKPIPYLWALYLRRVCYSFLFKEMGKKCNILDSVTINNAMHVSLGDRVSIHQYCWISGCGDIVIGNNVAISNGTTIVSETHNFDNCDMVIKDQGVTAQPITIEDDVWIGSRVVLLGNIVIGRGSIIGAGSVVNRDIPPYSIAVGSPCRVIKKRK